jgi:hypothetical protein
VIKTRVACFTFLHTAISNSGIHFEHASIFMIKLRKLLLPFNVQGVLNMKNESEIAKLNSQKDSA